MTMSRYVLLALAVVAIFAYAPKISGSYESTTVGATVGGVAGAILTSGTPLGLVGGIVVGGWIGNKMESDTTNSNSVVTLRQPKSLNGNS